MKRLLSLSIFSLVFLLCLSPIEAQKKSSKGVKENHKETTTEDISYAGLSFRSIGPAVTGGRIIDIEVNPENHSEYYVASGHGSLWKTVNNGTTFKAIFDAQNSYSIGAVTLDPSNPNIVWVGTGENNAQSNVIPGDGVYMSEDGGKSWKHKGLSKSQQIGEIIVHPENSAIIWVAAYGSHRQSGGERGIYKSEDGGTTWERTLYVSEHTGCWELHMDPRDADVIYAVAHQRQRRHYTIIGGGDESGIHKSTDGGRTWKKLKGGLPQKNVGRIGMDISPVNPDILYAVVNAKDKKGFYVSYDRGASWTKQSNYSTSYAFYMQKIFCDTEDINKIYAMDIFAQISKDGGKTWKNLGEDKKHVDNHALWIDPDDNQHLLSGTDGGLYESYDGGKNWVFKSNIPIAEIYKVSVDNAKPFYNVFIGTQDNLTLGGPSRTLNSSGIVNSDWTFILGGDGFETQVDWKDPNIIYCQYQNGNLHRYDKRSGELLYIKSHEVNDTAYRFDWDAALLLSRHDHKRLYHGGNKLLRSDDQGLSWKEISPDLTRGVPKEFLPLMERSWSKDELIRKGSVAQIATIAESPLDENILYTGSGDGLLYYTRNGGENWFKGKLVGLPEYARIHHIVASFHDKNIAYAACQDLFGGDYRPFLFKTIDGGENWFSINNNLPELGSTFSIGEDHINPNLLFVGTMYGAYFSVDDDPTWIKFSSGIPNSVTVMDLDIQRDKNDLVLSTFGRGVYILDDYSPLRELSDELLNKEAHLFNMDTSFMFIEANPFGFPGVAFQGASFYTAPNPEIGAVFTYYLKDKPKSLKDIRREKEKKLQEEGKDIAYPTYDALKKEQLVKKPYLLFTILDEEKNVVKRIKKNYSKGIQRLVWDFRYNPVTPVSLAEFDSSIPWNSPDVGFMVPPGKYYVKLSKVNGSQITDLCEEKAFICKGLNLNTFAATDQAALDEFNRKVASLGRALYSAEDYLSVVKKKFKLYEIAIIDGENVDLSLLKDLESIKEDHRITNELLKGDPIRSGYEGASRISLKGRIDMITSNLWNSSAAQTATFERAYNEVADDFENILGKLNIIEKKINQLEQTLENSNARGTPGRIPSWKR